MLIDLFLKLKSHRLPVSIKEYLTLLEAMQRGVIGPSVEDFYYLSRTALPRHRVPGARRLGEADGDPQSTPRGGYGYNPEGIA
jgi:uncharacterized protein with von Willebrand factor type A (vWA) domain